MTAKDILRKTNRDNNYGGVISGGSILEKSIIEAMNTYALSVIEEAVQYVGRTTTFKTKIEAEASSETLRQVLTRIKNELGE